MRVALGADRDPRRAACLSWHAWVWVARESWEDKNFPFKGTDWAPPSAVAPAVHAYWIFDEPSDEGFRRDHGGPPAPGAVLVRIAGSCRARLAPVEER